MVRHLLQREVAQELGISTSTYCNWEVGRTEPEIRYMAALHRFLGFCAYDPAWTFGERLRAAREAQGWSRDRAARMLGIDPGTIRDAEAGERRATRRSREILRALLSRRSGLVVAVPQGD